MSASVLYGLVLFSAVAHSIWNSLVKSAGDRVLTMVMIRGTGLVLGLATSHLSTCPIRKVGSGCCLRLVFSLVTTPCLLAPTILVT